MNKTIEILGYMCVGIMLTVLASLSVKYMQHNDYISLHCNGNSLTQTVVCPEVVYQVK